MPKFLKHLTHDLGYKVDETAQEVEQMDKNKIEQSKTVWFSKFPPQCTGPVLQAQKASFCYNVRKMLQKHSVNRTRGYNANFSALV